MTTTSLTRLLSRLEVDEDDLVRAVEERLAATPSAGSAQLSTAEVDVWSAHAGLPLHDAADPSALTAQASVLEDLLVETASSVTIDEAATRLGIDRTRVHHRLRHGDLYAFPLGRQRRLPVWQLTDDGRALPGLAPVLAALPKGLHPSSVAGFFTTPDPDLDDLTAARWLASGGDVGAVVARAAGLGHW